MISYVCAACDATYPLDPAIWHCPCGGILDLSPRPPAPVGVERDEGSLWRYRQVLPFDAGATAWRGISLGEGMTPLVAETSGGRGVWLKLDFLMPTLSYKDRGAAVLVAKAAEMGVHRLVADSSGNAGTSIAAYAARAKIAATVFVPSGTSVGKVTQLRAFGASVRQLDGSRADTAAAAIEWVEHRRDFYASHVYNPLFLQGTKTFAYELWEQLGGRLPGTVVVPAGNGTLLLGAAIGFAELVAAGSAPQLPRLVAVQSQRCAPVAAAWAGGTPHRGAWGSTVAEGIAIPEPPRLVQMVDAVRASGGLFLTVSEEQILDGRARLRSRGIDVEPTAAAVWGAWQAWAGAADTARPVVVALTGAGLKSPMIQRLDD